MPQKEVQRNESIVLVTPVWKDAERLRGFGRGLAATLVNVPYSIHWVIADDGSGDEERQRLKQLRAEFLAVFPEVSLYFADDHRGKGAVVREAWAEYPEVDWLAFVDADGSLSPDELVRMLDTGMESGCSVLAIRKRTEETRVALSFPRMVAHRLFRLAVQVLVGLRCEDPQCGAKLLRADDYRAVAGRLEEDGLAFDAEMLAAMAGSGSDWKELPVTWIEKDGGKVRPLRDAWGMLAALWRIRSRQAHTTPQNRRDD
ncbi:glycosyltransferase [Verrucomicrobiaceae bacterium N1E253]|uniref:Glycosyltransferase n=1 Tax=Oceaniferula marina TaxID=2748318 RepID=A0A851GN37_9BACT|nr:glycosyltransferase [Oceaniferula marina]NWK56250.1 glycosyltransferase [Oceaniferula marina]